jgi:hypothetical protein
MEKVNHRVVDNVEAMEKVNHRIVDNVAARAGVVVMERMSH